MTSEKQSRTLFVADFNEWWPVYEVMATQLIEGTPGVDFTEEEVADLRRVSAEFKAWQEKLAERVGNTGEVFRFTLFDEGKE